MIRKIEHLLESFQGNAYPAMTDDLGDWLGVSGDSVRRLAVGWAPIVPFKRTTNFQGWWAIPERDETARTIGLSLRSQDDVKVMFPGSKHGLIYEVNPDHGGGNKGYDPGPQNWVRTMDAGMPCPVCGKPDGCLLSAENPADPRAVVCIRKREESIRELRMGFLHVRKSEGHLKHASVLLPSQYPVVCVEGFSDTAAAMDLGLVSVGRPSNLACIDMLRDVLRGRPVIIVGENDRKEDGSEPGKNGMIAAFQILKTVCRDVRMLMPPKNVKDLRAWVVTHHLVRDEFLDFAQKQGEQQVDATVITDDRPTTISRTFLDQCHRLAGRYTLRRWESNWYRYSGTKYSLVKDEAFIKPLYGWGEDKTLQRENPKTGEITFSPLKVDLSLVNNLKQALVAQTLVEDRHQPCWINGATGPNPKDLIVFNNGILDVPAFLDGRTGYLLDSTPDLFTTAAIPLAFDPTATCPHWLDFLGSSLGDDPAKITLLQEWIGYCLTPDTTYQKMMYFRGPPSCGKGRILEVLRTIVGEEQTASPSFKELSKDFGLAPLVGKLVCLIPDARTPKYGDSSAGLETLLSITGNDAMQINRKNKDHLESMSLICRITIASNGMLDIPDTAGAMIRRLNFIQFDRSFERNPDVRLPARLAQETAGIVVWALAGLRRLRENDCFTVPASSIEAMQEWRLMMSPVAAFLEDCCDSDGGEVLKRELYDAWEGWRSERRFVAMTTSKFYESIRYSGVNVSSDTYEKGGHKLSVFRGIKLKTWAARKYVNRP